MLQSSTVEERILYWLSLDTQVRALAERLLERFCRNSGQPASQRRAPPHLGRRSLAVWYRFPTRKNQGDC